MTNKSNHAKSFSSSMVSHYCIVMKWFGKKTFNVYGFAYHCRRHMDDDDMYVHFYDLHYTAVNIMMIDRKH